MAKKKTETKTRLVALLGLTLMISVGLIIVYVPVMSEDVECFTTPCPPIKKTIYDLIIESYGQNEEPCLNESCTVPVICIDGIYFGVCGGEPVFNQGQACFGLTTQQCFDKCNVIGNSCRVEEPVACIEIFQPVCGIDGVTYSNSCFAGVAGVQINHQGEC